MDSVGDTSNSTQKECQMSSVDADISDLFFNFKNSNLQKFHQTAKRLGWDSDGKTFQTDFQKALRQDAAAFLDQHGGAVDRLGGATVDELAIDYIARS